MNDKVELIWNNKKEKLKNITNFSCKLYEVEELSYGKDQSKNILIHGDNIDALKILMKDYKNKIKCIYIDPPYNSEIDFQHYSDKYTHSEWLTMMSERLILLKELLKEDGFIFIQIDNRELHYLKVLMDEIFGRENYRNSIIINKEFDKFSNKNAKKNFMLGYDTILVYSKKETTLLPVLFSPLKQEEKHGLWKNLWCMKGINNYNYSIFGISPINGTWLWPKEKTLVAMKNYQLLVDHYNGNINNEEEFERKLYKYLDIKKLEKNDFPLVRNINGRIEYYIYPTEQEILSDNWNDITIQGRKTNFEHEVNEEVLIRIISNFTYENDIILDAFLGSGTSVVIASKLNRNWIGIEAGEHCYSICRTRLKKIIDENFNSLGYKFYEIQKEVNINEK